MLGARFCGIGISHIADLESSPTSTCHLSFYQCPWEEADDSPVLGFCHCVGGMARTPGSWLCPGQALAAESI